MKNIGVPLALIAGLALPAGRAFAHVSPPVVLATEAETLRDMIGRAEARVVRRIRLSPAQRQSVRQDCGCKANDVSYRAYLAGPEGGRAAAVIFLSESTQHGPVRVAVGLGRDGRVTAARVVEVTEETLNWIKPLIDQDLPGDYVGRGSGDDFGISERFEKMRPESMRRFYARMVSSLIRRAAIVYDVAVRPRD